MFVSSTWASLRAELRVLVKEGDGKEERGLGEGSRHRVCKKATGSMPSVFILSHSSSRFIAHSHRGGRTCSRS